MDKKKGLELSQSSEKEEDAPLKDQQDLYFEDQVKQEQELNSEPGNYYSALKFSKGLTKSTKETICIPHPVEVEVVVLL